MRQETIQKIKDVTITPISEHENDEQIQMAWEYPDIPLTLEHTTTIGELFDTYFVPLKGYGQGWAYRVQKNVYAFSTKHGLCDEGQSKDVSVTWQDGRYTYLAMSPRAEDDLKEYLRGILKPGKATDAGMEPIENPQAIADRLKKFTAIRGDGVQDTGDGTLEHYGSVTGVVGESSEREPIPKSLWEFLQEEKAFDFAGGVVRTFSVAIPEKGKELYNLYLQLKLEQKRTHRAYEKKQEAEFPHIKRMEEIQQFRDQDPEVQKADDELRQKEVKMQDVLAQIAALR